MYELPAGEYFIGDPCYVLDEPNFDWSQILKDTNYFESKSMKNGGIFEIQNLKYAVFSTSYGDGCYNDNYNNLYSVDSGCIGCIPTSLLNNIPDKLGKVFNFNHPFYINNIGTDIDLGILIFGYIIIDTNGTIVFKKNKFK